jgi:hypothetical protein
MSTSQRVRLAGTAYAVGGLLWFMVMTGLTMVFGGDPPAGSAAFLASETIYSIVQALLLFGFFGIYWGGGVGQGVFGKIAFGLGALGHLVFPFARGWYTFGSRTIGRARFCHWHSCDWHCCRRGEAVAWVGALDAVAHGPIPVARHVPLVVYLWRTK